MWDELGIAACDDPKAIRRAYAVRLKELDPDRDLEAFTRLREALEWALVEAGRGSPPSLRLRDFIVPDTAPDDTNALDAPVARTGNNKPPNNDRPATPRSAAEDDSGMAPESFGAEPADRVLIDQLDSALSCGVAVQAVELFLRAVSTGALSLRAAPLWLERVFAVAVEGHAVEPAAFREFARTFGWDKPVHDGTSAKLRERVLARLGAEDWLDQLTASADNRGEVTRKQVKLARLMLGRIGRHWMPRIDRGALRSHLDRYQIHENWVGGRIDPEWARILEKRWRRREIGVLLFYNVFLAAMLIDGIIVFVREAAAGTLSTGLAAIGLVLSALLIWLVKWLPMELLRLLRTSPPF